MSATASARAATGDDVRPFTFEVPEEQLADLRRRTTATKGPDREIDPSQGVRLETIQALADYWATDYDWRTFEERFAALPHFITEIDGVDIHFIHVRSAHEGALPLIVTHGWPGSTIEQFKNIDPLTKPTEHGASASDAFHLVIPSLPGHGLSGKPTQTGWDPIRIARGWVELMHRLGYAQFVAQGGDWGNTVTEQMALLKPPGLLGIHTNMPATVPPEVAGALAIGDPPPSGLTADEKNAYEVLVHFFATGVGYANEMANRPQTLYGIADSPIGLAAWMLDHDVRSYELIARAFAGQPGGLSRDDVLDNVTYYWLTNTAISSARLYWESKLAFFGEQVVLAVDAIALMDALPIERATVAGFDWGSRAAAIMAALWPERCAALVAVSGYLIGSIEANQQPLPPKAELGWWYLFYFSTDRGRLSYSRYTHEFNKLIWRVASPKWAFDDATFERTAASFDNPDHVEIVIHNYRWRLGLVGDERYLGFEHELAERHHRCADDHDRQRLRRPERGRHGLRRPVHRPLRTPDPRRHRPQRAPGGPDGLRRGRARARRPGSYTPEELR
jgi:pimeloyl-ACP methyl ester carboxylesterase